MSQIRQYLLEGCGACERQRRLTEETDLDVETIPARRSEYDFAPVTEVDCGDVTEIHRGITDPENFRCDR